MLATYRAIALQGYTGTLFKQLVDQHGGVQAAKRLLAKQDIQSGLMELCLANQLYNSMEVLVLKEKFQVLFTEEERQEARRRLEELGYNL